MFFFAYIGCRDTSFLLQKLLNTLLIVTITIFYPQITFSNTKYINDNITLHRPSHEPESHLGFSIVWNVTMLETVREISSVFDGKL